MLAELPRIRPGTRPFPFAEEPIEAVPHQQGHPAALEFVRHRIPKRVPWKGASRGDRPVTQNALSTRHPHDSYHAGLGASQIPLERTGDYALLQTVWARGEWD